MTLRRCLINVAGCVLQIAVRCRGIGLGQDITLLKSKAKEDAVEPQRRRRDYSRRGTVNVQWSLREKNHFSLEGGRNWHTCVFNEETASSYVVTLLHYSRNK